MRKAVSQRLSDAYDAAQKNAERYELQELSAVPTEEIGGFCPRTAVNQQVLERVIARHHAVSRRISICIPSCAASSRSAREALAKGGPIDWAFGEALAFGSLVLEGTPVRLSGQDSGRGTFSQRHLAFYDSETGERYIPLQHSRPTRRASTCYDSSLSEYAVLGFEFGYSVADPLTLVMWEAQFGDFANGAQIMIDQFISSGGIEMGPAQRPGDAAAARLRRPGSGAFQRAHRALPARSAPRTICRCATAPRRRSTSTCCGARCTAARTAAACASR